MPAHEANQSGRTSLSWDSIANRVPVKSRVLIVGDGSGLSEVLAKEKGCEIIECSAKDLDSETLDDLGKFDCLVFPDVSKLNQPIETLKKAKTIMSKGSSIVFAAPNMAHLATRLQLAVEKNKADEEGQLFRTSEPYYDYQELERVLAHAGLSLESLERTERDIADSVLASQFEALGVKPPKQYFDSSRRVGARAYDFVGQARVVEKNTADAQSVSGAATDQIRQLQLVYERELNDQRLLYETEIDRLAHREAGIISSLSWKLTLPLRLANGMIIRARQKLRMAVHGLRKDPRMRPARYFELASASKAYERNKAMFNELQRQPQTTGAVIIHLYYVESWPALNEKIQNLQRQLPLDLFVTLPPHNRGFGSQIKTDYPGAYIFEVPNRGRDVLPFVQTAAILQDLGYEFVLKLHSKKSPHREDGQEWFSQMLGNLLPENSAIHSSLIAKLKDKNTGIIGPQGQYISLLVNYHSNAFFLHRVLKRLYSKDVTKLIDKNRDDYGFFAGTMFWARLDALAPILDQNFQVVDFEHEGRHIDGTLAHALERVFCLVPEINGKQMFEVGDGGVTPVSYETTSIPEWSDMHPANRNKKPKRRKLFS